MRDAAETFHRLKQQTECAISCLDSLIYNSGSQFPHGTFRIGDFIIIDTKQLQEDQWTKTKQPE